MDATDSNLAEQIARAASAFEQLRTGRSPQSVTVVMSGKTLVVTLNGVLSPAEMALAKKPEGAAQVQEFHRQLFSNASVPLREEIKRITGVEVSEATAELESPTGTAVGIFTSGTIVQMYLLADPVVTHVWSDDKQSIQQ